MKVSPTTWPRLLMAFPELEDPPRVPRSVMIYDGVAAAGSALTSSAKPRALAIGFLKQGNDLFDIFSDSLIN